MKQGSSVLTFVLGAASFAAAQVGPDDALVTPAPKIRAAALRPIQRDVGDLSFNDPRFEGWQTLGGYIVQRTCNTGYTYSSRGSMYNCCTTGVVSCSFVDQCFGAYSEVFTSPATTFLCQGGCITGLLYSNTADSKPLTHYGCGSYNYWIMQTSESSALSNFIGSVPVTAIGTTTTTKGNTAVQTSTTTTPTTGTSTATTDTATTSHNLITTTTPAAATTSPGPTLHLGPILGGAVGGGILLLAFILCCAFSIWRKRSRRPTPVPAPVMNQYPPQNQQPYPPQGQYPPQQQYGNVPPQQGYGQDVRHSYVPPTSPPPMYGGQAPQQGYYAAPKAMEPVVYPVQPGAVEIGSGR